MKLHPANSRIHAMESRPLRQAHPPCSRALPRRAGAAERGNHPGMSAPNPRQNCTLERSGGEPRRFAFYLAPNLSMIAFSAALEPLRIANRMSNRLLYSWTIHSADGEAVRCSNGVSLAVDEGLVDFPGRVLLFVCSGIDVQFAATPPVLAWLRRQDRRGVALGAICTGSYILARADLLEGRRCTIHWENIPGVIEEFPSLRISNQIYEIDRGRYTCGGGTSAADLMLRIISDEHGVELAALVSEQILYTARGPNAEQRLSVPGRIGVRHPRLVAIIRSMEANLEHPLRLSALADEAGMSTRQLERLFRRYLNRSPKRYYMELRLKRARSLLLQTEMSVIDVALACGFASPSHFSKCYRQHYERTPFRDRGAPEPSTRERPPMTAGIDAA